MNIVVSIGDCNGIGIEVLLKALPELRHNLPSQPLSIRIATHPQSFLDYAAALGIPVHEEHGALVIGGAHYPLIPCATYAPVQLGTESESAGALAYESLERAVDAWYDGTADAIVTMPVSKTTLRSAGFSFPGQTEFFAAKAGVGNPLMILCHENVRVALATIHEPLAAVPALLTDSMLCERISMFRYSLLQDFGCARPRIAVLGCNPHAGENGHIGREEIEIIQPAVSRMREMGMIVDGPFAADGFFAHGEYKNYDGILAMYHDQGLIPLKLLAQGAGVNVTAGLPIVRTSPDHGTAFALAGKNMADPRSTVQAMIQAIEIVQNRHRS
jgi:4-hydroxythreonine-4-phosphate dehydrogenase